MLFAQAPGGVRAAAHRKSNKAFLLTVGGDRDGGVLPSRFTCDGKNVSPVLNWSAEPEGTQSFALIVDDPDARNFSHWPLWDIPASVHSLAEGAVEGAPGTNDFGNRRYDGPCPPAGRGPHDYSFRLYAVDVPSLGLKAGKGRNALDDASASTFSRRRNIACGMGEIKDLPEVSVGRSKGLIH